MKLLSFLRRFKWGRPTVRYYQRSNIKEWQAGGYIDLTHYGRVVTARAIEQYMRPINSDIIRRPQLSLVKAQRFLALSGRQVKREHKRALGRLG